MSAATPLQVQPITAQPIRRPQYDNRGLGDFRFWYATNEPALTQYWNELGGYGEASEASEADDFLDFAMTQHDLQGNLPAVADFGWL